MDQKEFGVAAVVLGVVILVAIFLPKYVAQRQFDNGRINAEQILLAENEQRNLLLQFVGGIVVAGGIFIAFKRMKTTQSQLSATEKQIDLVQKGQINDRFSRAVELLSNEQLDVRIGALITLEEICYESEKLSKTIFKIIHAFVSRMAGRRYKKKKNLEKTEADVLEGLNILFRISGHYNGWIISLKDIYLVDCDFIGDNLEKIIAIRLNNCRIKEVYFGLNKKTDLRIVYSKIQKSNFISDFAESSIRINGSNISDNSDIDVYKGSIRIVNSIITGSTIHLYGKEYIKRCLFQNVTFSNIKHTHNFGSNFYFNCMPTPFGISKEQIINDGKQYLEKVKEWSHYNKFEL